MTRGSREGRPPIDWDRVRARLGRAAGDGSALSPEAARAVLDERARLLARTAPAEPRRHETMEVLELSLAGERYAIETCHVREVLRSREITPVPGTPAFVYGVLQLRGQILVVLDPRRLFSPAVPGLDDLARVIVLGGQRPELGILADQASELGVVSRAAIAAAPASIALGREYVLGAIDGSVLLLDGAAILAAPALYVDHDSPTATGGASP